MIVDEQIQSYRDQFLSWQNQTTPIWLCCGNHEADHQLSLSTQLDPELMRVHVNVWHQRRTANHNTEQARERASDIQNSFVKG